MKTKLPPLQIILALLVSGSLACGCKNKAAQDEGQLVTDVPPSISGGESNGKQAFVRLTDREAAELDIPLFRVSAEIRQLTLTAPATVYPAPNHIGVISAPVEGRILNLPLQEGESVKKGQVIMELESLTFGTLVAEYLQALAELELLDKQLDRMEKLAEKKISPEAELEKVRADHERAIASLNACYAKLKTVGVSDGEIESYKTNERINPRLKVYSPITGIIDSHQVELGQAVAANDKLATVINLDQVLVKAYLAPEDGLLVKPGDSVTIDKRLVNEAPLKAVISTINPGLDEDNRSLVVNILLKMKGSQLKPGDNVRAEIVTESPVEVITIPMDAVTYDNNDPVVFVKRETNIFEMRRISIRDILGGSAVVTAGLGAGEELAAGQVFSLKALSRFKLISEE